MTCWYQQGDRPYGRACEGVNVQNYRLVGVGHEEIDELPEIHRAIVDGVEAYFEAMEAAAAFTGLESR